MLNVHRAHDAAVTALFRKPPPPESTSEAKKAPSMAPGAQADVVGIDDKGRLLYLTALADIEETILIGKRSLLYE